MRKCESKTIDKIVSEALEQGDILEYINTHSFEIPKTGGGNDIEQLSTHVQYLQVCEQQEPRSDGEVYEFVQAIQSHVGDLKNPNIQVLTKLALVTKIAADTFINKNLTNLALTVKDLLKAEDTSQSVDVIRINNGQTREATLNNVKKIVLQLIKSQKPVVTIELASFGDDETTSTRLEVPRNASSVSIKVTGTWADDDGAETNTETIQLENKEAIENFLSHENKGDESNSNSGTNMNDLRIWLRLVLDVVDAVNKFKQGGARNQRIRVPAAVRAHFKIPAKLTGQDAFNHIKKSAKKGDIAEYAGYSRGTSLSKDDLIKRVLRGARAGKN